ncbi:PDR/VanB family oxidoreductase [Spirillospora sp. NPDC048819]|uniref:PDR/VanB family oxidoreductase n=1 Tax=Spirillospora sp. NPDC048819 TaxID=3155268 RepID=UPI003404706B
MTALRARHTRPPAPLRWSTGLTIMGIACIAVTAAIGLTRGGAGPETIGWSMAAMSLIFYAVMARSGRQWGRVMLTVTAVLCLGNVLPGELSAHGTGSLPGMLTLLGAVSCLGACGLVFLPSAGRWVRTRKDEVRVFSPRLRKAVLTVHVIVALTWLGVITTMNVLAITAATSTDPGTMRSLITAMLLVEEALLGAPAMIAVLSGITLACGTRWGLFRHRWVAAKFLVMVTAILSAPFANRPALHAAHERAIEGAPVSELHASLVTVALVYPVIPIATFAVAVISVFKPWGMTRSGRRLSTGDRPGVPRTPVTVTGVSQLAQDVVSLRMAARDDRPLPAWEPGEHIDLVLPSGAVRQYSLSGDPADRSSYQIAVLRQTDGNGGSLEAHRLRPGNQVTIRGPRANFSLHQEPGYLFIAGGIGITPLLPMLDTVARRGAWWRLVYIGRTLPAMAYAHDLVSTYPGHVHLVPRDAQPRPDLDAVLRQAPPGAGVYCCGPAGLMDAVEALMPIACPTGSLHTERFAASGRPDDKENTPFDVVLQRSRRQLHVPADRTLLDTLRDVTPTLDSSCENGLCGSCRMRILDGEPDHRDDILTGSQRDRRDIIYPCVSRAHGRIVLDA